MALNPLLSKTFNEGAPLDPNQLNDLRTDIVNTYNATNVLYNDTKDGQTESYRFVFNCGSVTFSGHKKDTPKDLPLELGNGFAPGTPGVGDTYPRVTATVRTSLSSADNAIVYVTGVSSTPKIWIKANTTKDISVDWIAVQKVKV
jgi:hypothetical protein